MIEQICYDMNFKHILLCFITKGTSQSYVSKKHIDTQDNQQQQSLLIDTQYNVRKNILFFTLRKYWKEYNTQFLHSKDIKEVLISVQSIS